MLGLDPGNRAAQQRLRERIGVVLQEVAVEPFLIMVVWGVAGSVFPSAASAGNPTGPNVAER